MDARIDIGALGLITVDDYLPLMNLSFERAVDVLPDGLRSNYSTAWRWFMTQENTIGSRMLGQRIPGVSDDFAISAQRGIHVPARSPYAISITVKQGSIYSATDRPLIDLPNGTWILEYSAHRNNTGGKTLGAWNNGLINCMEDGLPVGIFIEVTTGRYERHLAYVEEYHPDRGVFTLHGPVTETNASLFSVSAIDEPGVMTKLTGEYSSATRTELEKDARRFANMRRAVRQGQGKFREDLLHAYDGRCACSGCGVAETLQAAHIIGYRGQRSNAVTNGLLLRADLHLLFDSSLISIDPGTYRVVASARLEDSEYEAFHDQRIRLPRNAALAPSPDYLAAHYEKFRHVELAA